MLQKRCSVCGEPLERAGRVCPACGAPAAQPHSIDEDGLPQAALPSAEALPEEERLPSAAGAALPAEAQPAESKESLPEASRAGEPHPFAVAEPRLVGSYPSGNGRASSDDLAEALTALDPGGAWAVSSEFLEASRAIAVREMDTKNGQPKTAFAALPPIDLEGVAAPPPRRATRRGPTRRAFLMGGLGVVGLAMAGSLALWIKRPQIASLPGGALLTYRGHTQIVTAVAWSPNQRRLVSASYDGTAQVWDASSGQRRLRYEGHKTVKTGGAPVVWAVAWSPDGTKIASAGEDRTVQVWDAASGKTLFTYRGHKALVHGLAWSPDGKRIASASYDYTVQVWDAADGGHALTYKGHSREALAVAWSPNGKQLVSSSNDYTAQVWDAATGAKQVIYKGHKNLGAGNFRGVYSVAWARDGKKIASGASDGTAQIWEAATGKTLLTYHALADDVRAVAWSPDATRLACAGDPSGAAQVFDAASGQTLFTAHCHQLIVDALAWSPDGSRIASGSFDRTACVWAISFKTLSGSSRDAARAPAPAWI